MSELKKLIKIHQKGNSTLRYDDKVWRISKLNIGDYTIEFKGEYVTKKPIGSYIKDVQSFSINTSDVVKISHLLFYSNLDKDIRFFDIQKEYNAKLNSKNLTVYSISNEIQDFPDTFTYICHKYTIGDFIWDRMNSCILYVNRIFDDSCEIFNLSNGTSKIQSKKVEELNYVIKNGNSLSDLLKRLLTLFKDLSNLVIEYNDITSHVFML